jgi:hypothetical protein
MNIITGECDCCGKDRELRRVIAYGIETMVCGDCLGGDDDIRRNEPMTTTQAPTIRVWTPDEIRAVVEYNRMVDPRDARRLLPGMDPIFKYHNCSRCRNGERACVKGNANRCSWTHARND